MDTPRELAPATPSMRAPARDLAAARASRVLIAAYGVFIGVSALQLALRLLGSTGATMDTIQRVLLGAWLLVAVSHCVWLNRTVRSVQRLGELPFGPHAWAWFFVPLFHLFKPFQITATLWRVQTGQTRPPRGFHAWWALWLAWLGSLHIVQRTAQGAADGDLGSRFAEVASLLLGIAAAYKALAMVRAFRAAPQGAARPGEPAEPARGAPHDAATQPGGAP